MDKNKAIEAYIKENFKQLSQHECCVCGTHDYLGEDELSSMVYCLDCLRQDLEKDDEALMGYE